MKFYMNNPTESLHICLLGATFSTNNMGVSALTDGAIRCCLYQFPHAQICILDYGEKRSTHTFRMAHGGKSIKFINMRFSKKLCLKNNILILLGLTLFLRLCPFKCFQRKILSQNEYLGDISTIDIFASVAGGDSFSDIYGLQNLLYVSLPQILAILMHKKLVLLPQTLGPFKSKPARWIAKSILQKADQVFVRDHTSINDVREIVGKRYNFKKIQFCYDMGFVVEPFAPREETFEAVRKARERGVTLVGLNVSGLLYIGGYTHDNMFQLKQDYKTLIYDIIHRLAAEKNLTVLLTPHVFGDTTHAESDAVACESIYKELEPVYGDRLLLIRGSFDHNEIKYIIGLCDLFIGSRMHACIAALSQFIPVAALAYSKKFFGIMQSLELDLCVSDLRRDEQRDTFLLIDYVLNNQIKIRTHLQHIIPTAQNQLFNMFADVVKRPIVVNTTSIHL